MYIIEKLLTLPKGTYIKVGTDKNGKKILGKLSDDAYDRLIKK